LGGDGGAETHTLTVAEIPAHDHARTLSAGALANSDESGATNTTSVKRSDFAVRSTGGDEAHNNMPPWLALNYIIRYA
jgi:microcystin-dependent protein